MDVLVDARKPPTPYLLRIDVDGNLELAWSKGGFKRKTWLQKSRITQIGFISCIGEPGCGKSLIVHRILKDLRKFKRAQYLLNLIGNTSGILLTPTPAIASLPGDDDNVQTDVYCLDLNCYERDDDRFSVLLEYCVTLSSVLIFVVDQTSKRNIAKSLKKLSKLSRAGNSVALVILRFWPTEKLDGSTFDSSLMDGLEFLLGANRTDSQTDDAAEFVEDMMQVFWNVYVSFPRSPDLNDLTLTEVGSKTGSWSKYLQRPFSVGSEAANYENIQKLLVSALSGVCQKNFVIPTDNLTSVPDRLQDKRKRYLADMLLLQSPADGQYARADSHKENLLSFESVSSGFPDDFGSLENTSTEWSFVDGDTWKVTAEFENAFEPDHEGVNDSKDTVWQILKEKETNIDDEKIVALLQIEFLKIELQVAMGLDGVIDSRTEAQELRGMPVTFRSGMKSIEEVGLDSEQVKEEFQNKLDKLYNDVSRITFLVSDFQRKLRQEILDSSCVDSNRLRELEADIALPAEALQLESEQEKEKLKSILENALRRSYNFFETENEIRIELENSRLIQTLNIVLSKYEEFMSAALADSVFSDDNLKKCHEILVQNVTNPVNTNLPSNFVWSSYGKQVKDMLGAAFVKFYTKNKKNVKELENTRKSVLQACAEAFANVGGTSKEFRTDFVWKLFDDLTKRQNPTHVELWRDELRQTLPSLHLDDTCAHPNVLNYSSDSDFEPKLRRKATAKDLEKVMERLSATLDTVTFIPGPVEEYARKKIHASTELLQQAGIIDFQIQNSIQQLEMIQDKVYEDYC